MKKEKHQKDEPKIESEQDENIAKRSSMVDTQIRSRGVRDERVLKAMENVPRHLFVPNREAHLAYGDHPLPIGHNQTISQPYIVAYMTEMLELSGDEKVLEIGTGSGYQAAVLSELAREVYSIEIVRPLCEQAKIRLMNLGYTNVYIMCGDGYKGWPEKAPFDAIIITAAPPEIPQALVDQLAPKGRMILPVGTFYQDLVLISKNKEGAVAQQKLIPVRFVPMTGGKRK